MRDPIEAKVNNWDQNSQPDAKSYRDINRKIIYLSERLFNDYEPNSGPNGDFFFNLNKWLDNVKDENDQKLLFELILCLFYIGREEINVLYREAYISNYARWLIDIKQIDFENVKIDKILHDGILETWFCPLSDSLRINQFYHINNIPGQKDFRPDWRSLLEFGDVDKIKKYIETNNIKYIVLLEDFIGNGGQVSKAVNFALNNLKEIPILIIPLIICPDGVRNAIDLEKQHSNLKISPVVIINEDSFVKYTKELNSSELFKYFHDLALRTYGQVSSSGAEDDSVSPYGPFGWRKTGGLVVMHTNTPNNTLPLIHYLSENWIPLFKRHKRI